MKQVNSDKIVANFPTKPSARKLENSQFHSSPRRQIRQSEYGIILGAKIPQLPRNTTIKAAD